MLGFSLTAGLLLTDALSASSESTETEHIVITGERMEQPLTIVTDPKKPRQPLPAHDGADYLKGIPGFSLIRKGGASSDPVFRGLAASRLTILTDGEMLLGGCGNRMDPPTAYIAPQSYDRLTIIKGPQTVLYGPGNTAATILFERNKPDFTEQALMGAMNLTLASADRQDANFDITAGNSLGYGRLVSTYATADNYKDGDGNTVHSAYERWSTQLELAWTPSADQWIAFKAGRSDGEAAYADRAMDGSLFKRDNLGLQFQFDNLNTWLNSLEGQVYYNYVDHVMDNYSLRDFVSSAMMPNPSSSNPDRRTQGGKLLADIALTPELSTKIGIDAQKNDHSNRSSMDQTMMPYQTQPRVKDAEFRQYGIFAELYYQILPEVRLIAGLRTDDWQTTDLRETLSSGMMAMSMPNPTFSQQRNEQLHSGFSRIEYTMNNTVWFAGLGYVERFPDYWELYSSSKGSELSLSAFNITAETHQQLDTGVIFKNTDWQLSASLFYNNIQDYILVQTDWPSGTGVRSVSRNIDATTFGAEADARYQINTIWHLEASLAYVRGKNDTDNTPLAQQPPLELKFSLNYSTDSWSFSTLWRVVAQQNRIALNQGNIVGQDHGQTAGFGTLSVNGSRQLMEKLTFSFGIDNLLDKTYAEHLSKSGAMVNGYLQTDRVNEPGRTLWLNLGYKF